MEIAVPVQAITNPFQFEDLCQVVKLERGCRRQGWIEGQAGLHLIRADGDQGCDGDAYRLPFVVERVSVGFSMDALLYLRI